MSRPRRGEVWLVNLDPTIGVEIQKTRPAVIIQNDIQNRYSPLTIVLPLTSAVKRLGPTTVLVHPPEGGLDRPSVILVNHIRAIDQRRLIKRLGRLTPETLDKVAQALKISQGLIPL